MSQLIAAFKEGWLYLAIYYAVAIPVAVMMWREFELAYLLCNSKSRIILAAVLAAIFTPSIISDFWLFMIPGPAVLGLLLLVRGCLINISSDPSFSVLALRLIALYHILPLAAGSIIAYVILSICNRFRTPRRQSV